MPSQNEAKQPTHVRISIADLKISEAVDHVLDGDAHYIRWMPAIIDRFRMTYAEYWDLSVAEHQTFIEYLEPEEVSDGV